MSNEQRAHDLAMFYVKMYYDSARLNNIIDGFEYDAIAKYNELYPEILKQINEIFPN